MLLGFPWHFLYSTFRDAAVTDAFVKSMTKVGGPLGMKFGKPKVVAITDNRPATYVQALQQIIPMKPSIVMVIIPNNKVRLLVFTSDMVFTL